MQKIVKSLASEFLRSQNENLMEELLLGLFTPKELQEFAKRLEIIKLLKKNIPQHKIAKELGVGVATVSRGAKELEKGRFSQV